MSELREAAKPFVAFVELTPVAEDTELARAITVGMCRRLVAALSRPEPTTEEIALALWERGKHSGAATYGRLDGLWVNLADAIRELYDQRKDN